MPNPHWDQVIHVVLLLLFMSAGAVGIIAGLAPLMFPEAGKSKLANPRLAKALIVLAILGLVLERLYHVAAA